ncbi:hypothetical protein IFM51744_05187, partial [Aspergillus udagawae]
EGNCNRVLQATFNDGYEVIVRLPYRITVPKRLATASEATTLDLLRDNGVPVPKVLGTEYIMLEKLEGIPLSERDLGESQLIVPIPGQSDQVVLDPTVQHEWWYRERSLLDVDHSPEVLTED